MSRAGPISIWKVAFPTPKIGDMDTELFREWFQAFAQNAGITLHVETLYGDNSHHIAETCFKGLARALAGGDRHRSAAGGAGALDQGDAVARAMLETDAAPAKRKPRVSRCMTQSPTGVFTAAAIAEIFA